MQRIGVNNNLFIFDRPEAPNVVVLIMDYSLGSNKDKAIAAAEEIRGQAKLLVVGLRTSRQTEMMELTGSL